jgi:hypothetical protein
VRRGHTLLSQLVAAGEFKMVIDQYDHIEELEWGPRSNELIKMFREME